MNIEDVLKSEAIRAALLRIKAEGETDETKLNLVEAVMDYFELFGPGDDDETAEDVLEEVIPKLLAALDKYF